MQSFTFCFMRSKELLGRPEDPTSSSDFAPSVIHQGGERQARAGEAKDLPASFPTPAEAAGQLAGLWSSAFGARARV